MAGEQTQSVLARWHEQQVQLQLSQPKGESGLYPGHQVNTVVHMPTLLCYRVQQTRDLDAATRLQTFNTICQLLEQVHLTESAGLDRDYRAALRLQSIQHEDLVIGMTARQMSELHTLKQMMHAFQTAHPAKATQETVVTPCL